MKCVINEKRRTATIRLYGGIGSDIDGNIFAQVLAEMADDKRVDVVEVRINSGGGNVIDGMSIVSAIRSSRNAIHCYVDGIAASMAAVIAVSGDKLFMMDYAKLMIHDPYFSGSNKDLGPKEQKALNAITDMLQTILSRKGIAKEEIGKLMQEETWFSAEEAVARKLADGIIVSNKKDLGGISTHELYARINNTIKENKMNEIAKLLGLPEDATEQQICDRIKVIQQENETNRQQVIESMIAVGVKNGTVTDKNKDRMIRLAKADFSLFAEMINDAPVVDNLPVQTPPAQNKEGRLSAAICQLNGGKAHKEDKKLKTWAWYQENDPEFLNKLEKDDPDKFKELLNEYENSL